MPQIIKKSLLLLLLSISLSFPSFLLAQIEERQPASRRGPPHQGVSKEIKSKPSQSTPSQPRKKPITTKQTKKAKEGPSAITIGKGLQSCTVQYASPKRVHAMKSYFLNLNPEGRRKYCQELSGTQQRGGVAARTFLAGITPSSIIVRYDPEPTTTKIQIPKEGEGPIICENIKELSSSGRQHVRDTVDRWNEGQVADVHCQLFFGFAKKWNVFVPAEYQDFLPHTMQSPVEVQSTIWKNYNDQVRPFCEGRQGEQGQNPEHTEKLARTLFDFYKVLGTVADPFPTQRDYIHGVGCLFSYTHEKIFGEREKKIQ